MNTTSFKYDTRYQCLVKLRHGVEVQRVHIDEIDLEVLLQFLKEYLGEDNDKKRLKLLYKKNLTRCRKSTKIQSTSLSKQW